MNNSLIIDNLKLLDKRILLINGEITDVIGSQIVMELLYLDSINNNDIYLYINSNGGSVNAGLAIYDTIKYIKSDVNTICIGRCYSIATFILSSGTKGKRYSLSNSEIMIHDVSGGIEGKLSDIEIETNRILELKKIINKLLAKNTNKTINKINKDTKNDLYMNSFKSLKYGIIDTIL